MSRAQEYRWVAEVHNSLRTVIGDGLRQQLEAPRELPSELASLVAQIASPNASLRVSMPHNRVSRSGRGRYDSILGPGSESPRDPGPFSAPRAVIAEATSATSSMRSPTPHRGSSVAG